MKRPELKILLLALALMLAACGQPVTNPPGGGAQPSGAAPATAAPPGY